MTPEMLSLIAAYVLCAETAEIRLLDPEEGRICVQIFLM